MLKPTTQQKHQINQIGRGHRLDMVILHGSQATGKIVSPDPDVDIAVFRRGGIDFDERLKLINEFMGIFGNDVDLKTLHRKDPLFLHLAMRDSQLLFGNRAFYNEFRSYAFHRYVDAKPIFNLQRTLVHKGIQSLMHEFQLT